MLASVILALIILALVMLKLDQGYVILCQDDFSVLFYSQGKLISTNRSAHVLRCFQTCGQPPANGCVHAYSLICCATAVQCAYSRCTYLKAGHVSADDCQRASL